MSARSAAARSCRHARAALGTEPQRTTEAIAPAKLQGNRFGDQLQTGLLSIVVCSESQLAQSALQSVDRKHVVEDLAGAATGGLQTVQRVIQARLACQPRDQRHHALWQMRRQIAPIALTSQ